MTTPAHPICGYDFTIAQKKKDGTERSKDLIIKLLTEIRCKAWVFQLEEGNELGADGTGYLHFQGRFRLEKKCREKGVVKAFNLILEGTGWGRLSPTVRKTFKNEAFDYVMKPISRVDGPWDNLEVAAEAKIPEKYRGNFSLRPFQQSWHEKISIKPNGIINCIVDKQGQHGKSTFATWLQIKGKAALLPPIDNYKEVSQIVCAYESPNKLNQHQNCYIVDIPRAVDNTKLKNLMSAIESVADGRAWDTRYKYDAVIFDVPHLWVCTNNDIPIGYLTAIRWLWWCIINNELVPYDPLTHAPKVAVTTYKALVDQRKSPLSLALIAASKPEKPAILEETEDEPPFFY